MIECCRVDAGSRAAAERSTVARLLPTTLLTDGSSIRCPHPFTLWQGFSSP